MCSDERGWTENPLVYCDGQGCTVAVHQGTCTLKQLECSPLTIVCNVNFIVFQRVMVLSLYQQDLGIAGNANPKNAVLGWYVLFL